MVSALCLAGGRQWECLGGLGGWKGGWALAVKTPRVKTPRFLIQKRQTPNNRQEGYDHSYFFISTFMGEHVDFHANALLK